MREREQLFTEYVTELKKASKQREEHQRHSSKSKAEKVRKAVVYAKFVCSYADTSLLCVN